MSNKTEWKANAYELFLSGVTKAAIARTFDVSPRTVGRWITEMSSVVESLAVDAIDNDAIDTQPAEEAVVETQDEEFEFYVLATRKSISLSKIDLSTGQMVDSVVVDKSAANFDEIFSLIANSKFEQSALKDAYILCNPKLMVEEITNGQLKVDLKSSTIMYSPEDGSKPYAVSDKLSSRVINAIKENGEEGASSILNFLNKLMLNPSYRAVNELYGFLQHNDIKLAENGNFYAWKVVRSDYMDKHSNTMLNAVGMRVEVPRNQVDEDSEKTCSFGLHVCAKHYISSYSGFGDRVVMVEVNPADVCAIPKDYNDSKMRCAGYDVVKDVTELFFS